MTINIHDIPRLQREADEYRRQAEAILDRAGETLVDDDADEVDRLTAAAKANRDQIRELQDQRDRGRDDLMEGVRSGRFGVFPGANHGDDYDRDPLKDHRDSDARFRGKNPWALREMQTFGRDTEQVSAELRARALSAIEAMPGASAAVRSAATAILEDHDSVDSRIARHVLVTSNPAYLRAWSKYAKNPQAPLLSEDEQRALAAAEQFRAMSLTDSAGGFLVPFQLDPAVIVTSSGTYSEITEVARQVVATGDVWNGVSSAACRGRGTRKLLRCPTIRRASVSRRSRSTRRQASSRSASKASRTWRTSPRRSASCSPRARRIWRAPP